MSEFVRGFLVLPWQRQALVVLSLAVAGFLIVHGAFVVRTGIRMTLRGLRELRAVRRPPPRRR